MKRNRKIISPNRRGSRSKTVPFQFIPDEIIFEFLSRLPVRSLLRFKSVSKSWYTLISSPRFVNCHLQLSGTDPDLSRHVIIFKYLGNRNLMCCPLSPVLNNLSTDASELNCSLSGVDFGANDWIKVIGCCNGLVCVVITGLRVLLWNPATRESNELPKPNMYNSKEANSRFYGFGYDECSGDYKVVAYLSVTRKSEEASRVVAVEVYSLRTGSWKRIQDFPGGFVDDCDAKFVNGRLYRFCNIVKGSGLGRVMLVSLNLTTEMYAELQLPPNPGSYSLVPDFGAIGDGLCVVYYYCSTTGGGHSDVWVLHEDGVKKSWTKLASVASSNGDSIYLSSRPFFISSTGEILLGHASRLMLYNAQDMSFKYPEIRNCDTCDDPDTYIESLVSPHVNSSGVPNTLV